MSDKSKTKVFDIFNLLHVYLHHVRWDRLR